MANNAFEPQEVIRLVDRYADEELRAAAQWENRWPFDSSGMWGLHQLARDVYALGVAEGIAQERGRASSQQQRERGAEAVTDR